MQDYVDRYKSDVRNVYSELQKQITEAFEASTYSKLQRNQVGSIPVKKTNISYDFEKNLNNAAKKLDEYRDDRDVICYSKELQEKASLVDVEAQRLDNVKEGKYVQ